MRIYFAAMESSDTLFPFVDNGLFSYYYLRDDNKKGNSINLARKTNPDMNIFIDSGAHSFFSATEGGVFAASSQLRKTDNKAKNVDVYMENYVRWVKDNWDCFNWYVELDIGELVGQKKVNEWYKMLQKEKVSSKCIRVFHPRVMTIDDYKDILNCDSKFIALEGVRAGTKPLPYGKLVRMAYEKEVKVHGFAMTKQLYLEKIPFYSVDSTSWQAGYRYGSGYVPEKNEVQPQILNINSRDEMTKRYYVSIRKSLSKEFSATERDNYLGYLGIQAYQKYEKYLTELWAKRGVVWKD